MLHMKRVNYQAYLWKHATDGHINPEPITQHGWEIVDKKPSIRFTTLPAAPEHLLELTTCSCRTSQCRSNLCSCRRKGLKCTDSCRCTKTECCNDDGEDDISESSDIDVE